jgi:hypothetical protein
LRSADRFAWSGGNRQGPITAPGAKGRPSPD